MYPNGTSWRGAVWDYEGIQQKLINLTQISSNLKTLLWQPALMITGFGLLC